MVCLSDRGWIYVSYINKEAADNVYSRSSVETSSTSAVIHPHQKFFQAALFLHAQLCYVLQRITFFIFLLRPFWLSVCSRIFFPLTSQPSSAKLLSSWPITFHHLSYPFYHKWPSAFNKTREGSEASMVKRSLPLHFPLLSAVVMESHVWKLYFPCGHSSILWVICSA